ncbi:hypothetical protein PF002_g24233 [Phytophthora fragariae]|uniref:Uncharacterized protein n=1 Tax=Phytophthora fragariae TaxID=53985 RepID=A0A6A3X4I4_9STRA|nr:hypothetical protein PF002_g24233 [Phytophthora fragariae]
MNWMTSGRHRALYSQRGRRRQMHFPSQVQRQRVRPTSPVRSSQPARARDSATPWYILQVGDDDESQDIRVLELERKDATRGAEVTTDARAYETAVESSREVREGSDGARTSPTQKRSRGDVAQDGRSDTRCIFTPIKKARKYDQLPSAAVQRAKRATGERPPSSIASGVDMLFFNDGEELPQKKRAQHAKQNSAGSAPSEICSDRFSQHRSESGDQKVQLRRQHCDDKDMLSRHSSDGENSSFYEPQTPYDGVSERDFKHLRATSSSYAGSDPGMALTNRESELFTSARDSIQEQIHEAPPLSPLAASPLPFRMSRAEGFDTVTQLEQSNWKYGQLSQPAQVHHHLRRHPHHRKAALYWDVHLQLGSPVLSHEDLGLGSPPNDICSSLVNDQRPDMRSLVISSPRSSMGSEGHHSISDAFIPIDAKERIMAAANSQQLPGDALACFQRPPIEETRGMNSSDNITGKKAMQRSWVMSSRTKRIIEAVSVSKTSAKEDLTHHSSTKYQEMESVAIYMYTLVQCYKIDESIRADSTTSPVADAQLPSKPTSPSTVMTVSKPTACRREIIFSPKHAK